MAQHYSDPGRAADAWSLPDVEVFYWNEDDVADAKQHGGAEELEPGWYYWFCFPGCMPDSEPIGPYETEQEAVDAAQDRD